MGGRSHGSRVLAGLALVAVTTMAFSAVLGGGWAVTAARPASMRAAQCLSAGVGRLALSGALPSVLLVASSRAIHPTSSLQPIGLRVESARLAALGALCGVAVAAVGLGWLEFARNSSRTRGQPREGVLII